MQLEQLGYQAIWPKWWASRVTLPRNYADVLTGEPLGQELQLGAREVRILRE